MADTTPDDVYQAAQSLLLQSGHGALKNITALKGGRNNRVYRVFSSSATGILKHYFRLSSGGHDRFGAEVSWYRFCSRQNIKGVAEYWGAEATVRCALFAEIPGCKLSPGDVTAQHVQQAAEFFSFVNSHRHSAAAGQLPLAADACFSIHDHLSMVQRRIQRLHDVPLTDPISRQLNEWLAESFASIWDLVQQRLEVEFSTDERRAVISPSGRCLSPSDFGFHNTLQDETGRLWFLDFEYAGWDDPAKMACDFFWQVDVPAPRSTLPLLLEALRPWGDEVPRRVEALFPLFGIKWCAIVLNEFLEEGSARRQFASGFQPPEDQRLGQLQIAERLLRDVQQHL